MNPRSEGSVVNPRIEGPPVLLLQPDATWWVGGIVLDSAEYLWVDHNS